ncbi:mechanosensitive ion channel protein MscS [Cereibacter changlensis JA139]|uniref:Mechanosensitive ion channel protein MscS n=2 Tax=Cereibacter changlensis TaxID=402884 RepID=A0A2T4JU81_9RHOB|nr:mechanosensitive ion channel domain-containing protein [Cereibacter changlensis]PTE21377.1 mechanosensitive ion channel protein MscS [Cereibacter changlensis JA139]PZX56474.1 small-conductance mechanosensitive channel [Cereibacter changlensis]
MPSLFRAFAAPLLLCLLVLLAPLGLAAPAQAQIPGLGGQSAAPAETEPSAAASLLDLLRDDSARAALIAELERAATGVAQEVEPPPPSTELLSFGRSAALFTQGIAESAAENVQAFWQALKAAPALFDDLAGLDLGMLGGALTELLLLIVSTATIFLILRRFAIPTYRRMGDRARAATLTGRVLLYIGALAIDILIVIGAWAIGYVVAIAVIGNSGQIGIRQTLYLNAFLAVELLRTAMRFVLSPSTRDLRIVALDDRAARYISAAASFSIALLGYGQLLIVPIVDEAASEAAGRGVSALISIIGVLFLAALVLLNRKPVADWLLHETQPVAPTLPVTEEAEAPVASTAQEIDPNLAADIAAGTAEPPAPPEAEPVAVEAAPQWEERKHVARRSPALVAMAQAWHWVALAYLAVLLMLSLVSPGGDAMGPIFASLRIAAVFIVGFMLSGALARAIARGVRLPASTSARLPLLERRLNRFVPQVLLVLRLMIAVTVVLFALHTIGIVDVGSWLQSQLGRNLLGTLIAVAAILGVAFAIWIALTSWIDYRLNPAFGHVATSREQTLLSLLRNAATIALIVVTLMFCLAEIGLNIGPLLASAGVLGLAIGFGAQKMVQDIITGIFIQFENAINVGDVVTVAGTSGVVERLTVRSVSLRDVEGIFHIIPFSSVDMVSNFMRDFSFYLCDMGVAYRENIGEVKAAMFDAFDELRRDKEHAPYLLADLEWLGLNAFGDSAIILRARIKTAPGKQWGAGRAYNEILKRIFDERNIEIPFPHQTIYFGEAKDGSTQALRVDRPAEA